MNYFIIILTIVSFLIVLLLLGAPLKPVRFIGTMFVKIAVGALLLFGLNVIGTQFALHIPINPITASVSGLLGLPGIAALVIIQLFIVPH